MADEHICEIIFRVLKSNPTLSIFIFAYNEDSQKQIEQNLKNKEFNNLKFIQPEGDNKFDFETINKLFFNEILANI